MDKAEYERIEYRDKYNFWHIGRREILLEALSRITKKTDNAILDIGCGPGGNIAVLKPFGRVTGLDNSLEALRYAGEKGYDNLIKGDILNLPFQDRAFDIVASLDVFEHLENDLRAIQECYRVLKPGGILFVTLPAHPFLWNEHDEYLEHVRRYKTREMLKKLRDAGFSVIKQSHFVTLGVPGILLRNFLKKIFPSRRKKNVYNEEPSRIVNAFFLFWLRLEKRFIRYCSLPLGSSLLVVVKKGE